MREKLSQVALFQYITSSPVNFAGSGPGPDSFESCLLRLTNCIVNQPPFRTRISHVDSPRHVRTVAREYNTEIPDAEPRRGSRCSCRTPMSHCRPLASRDDRRKSHLLRSKFSRREFKISRDFRFCDATPNNFSQTVEQPCRQCARATNAGDFVPVFHL